jgi:hypothetical protein
VIVAVVGAEASGKTTVAEALAKELAIPLLAGGKLEALARSGYHTLYEWSAATRGLPELLRQQARREREASSAVIDDGALDLLCTIERWDWNRLSPDAFEELRETAVAAARRYDHVLVTAPRIVAGHASHRFRNRAHALQTHRLLVAALGEIGLGERVHLLAEADAAATVAAALAAVRR